MDSNRSVELPEKAFTPCGTQGGSKTPNSAVRYSEAAGTPASHRRSIAWDEAIIALHDRDRGTRMRIDEPKTPFHDAHSVQASDEEDNETRESPKQLCLSCATHHAVGAASCPSNSHRSVLPEELFERLTELSPRRPGNKTDATKDVKLHDTLHSNESLGQTGPREPSDEGRDADDDADLSDRRRSQFEMKRKAHYNEFQVLRKLRESGSLNDEGESSDDN